MVPHPIPVPALSRARPTPTPQEGLAGTFCGSGNLRLGSQVRNSILPIEFQAGLCLPSAVLLFREPLPLQFCSLPCVDSASGRNRRAWCRELQGLRALIQVCPAGRLNLGSCPEWLLIIWLVPSSLYGERRVEGLHLSDTSRTAVTSNKQLLGKCEDPQFQQKCGSTSCLYEACMC